MGSPDLYFFNQCDTHKIPRRYRKLPEELPESLRFAHLNPKVAALLASKERSQRPDNEDPFGDGLGKKSLLPDINSAFQNVRNQFDSALSNDEDSQRYLFEEAKMSAAQVLEQLSRYIYFYEDLYKCIPKSLEYHLMSGYNDFTNDITVIPREWQTQEMKEQYAAKQLQEAITDEELSDNELVTMRSRSRQGTSTDRSSSDVGSKMNFKKTKPKLGVIEASEDGDGKTESRMGRQSLSRASNAASMIKQHLDVGSLSRLGSRRKGSKMSFYGRTPRSMSISSHRSISGQSPNIMKGRTGKEDIISLIAETPSEARSTAMANPLSYMQTINFQLSNTTFDDKGWVMLKGFHDEVDQNTILEYCVGQLQNAMKNIAAQRQKDLDQGFDKSVTVRYYGDTKKETLLKYRKSPVKSSPSPVFKGGKPRIPSINDERNEGKKLMQASHIDGSTVIYYPSGRPAVVHSASGFGRPGFYTIVYEDGLDSRVLACFTPSGRGVCYYDNGVVRFLATEKGGHLSESTGASIRKWKWPQANVKITEPVHFQLNNHVMFRCITQGQMTIVFSCQKEMARFSVGPAPDADEYKATEETDQLLTAFTFSSKAAKDLMRLFAPSKKAKKKGRRERREEEKEKEKEKEKEIEKEEEDADDNTRKKISFAERPPFTPKFVMGFRRLSLAFGTQGTSTLPQTTITEEENEVEKADKNTVAESETKDTTVSKVTQKEDLNKTFKSIVTPNNAKDHREKHSVVPDKVNYKGQLSNEGTEKRAKSAKPHSDVKDENKNKMRRKKSTEIRSPDPLKSQCIPDIIETDFEDDETDESEGTDNTKKQYVERRQRRKQIVIENKIKKSVSLPKSVLKATSSKNLKIKSLSNVKSDTKTPATKCHSAKKMSPTSKEFSSKRAQSAVIYSGQENTPEDRKSERQIRSTINLKNDPEKKHSQCLMGESFVELTESRSGASTVSEYDQESEPEESSTEICQISKSNLSTGAPSSSAYSLTDNSCERKELSPNSSTEELSNGNETEINDNGTELSPNPSLEKLSNEKDLSPNRSTEKLSNEKDLSPNSSLEKLSNEKDLSPNPSLEKLSNEKDLSPNPSLEKLSNEKDLSPNPSLEKLSSEKILSQNPSPEKLSNEKDLSPNRNTEKPSNETEPAPNPNSVKPPIEKISAKAAFKLAVRRASMAAAGSGEQGQRRRSTMMENIMQYRRQTLTKKGIVVSSDSSYESYDSDDSDSSYTHTSKSQSSEIIKLLTDFPDKVSYEIEADKELAKLQRKARNLVDDWMEHYRIAVGLSSPHLQSLHDKPGYSMANRKIKSAKISDTQLMLRRAILGVEDPESPRKTRIPSAPLAGPDHGEVEEELRAVGTESRLAGTTVTFEEVGTAGGDGTMSPTAMAVINRLTDNASRRSTRSKASTSARSMSPSRQIVMTAMSERAPSALSTSRSHCPLVIRQHILGYERPQCRCSRHHIPFVMDLELDEFVNTEAPEGQMIVIMVVSSLKNIKNRAEGVDYNFYLNKKGEPFRRVFPGITKAEEMLNEIYGNQNRNRTRACVQSRSDMFRVFKYDINSAPEMSDHTQPLLQTRHNVVPGMFLIYCDSKLLFCDHIFNGYGNTRKDFKKQIMKSKHDSIQGSSLPKDFRFSPSKGQSGMRSAWGGEIGGAGVDKYSSSGTVIDSSLMPIHRPSSSSSPSSAQSREIQLDAVKLEQAAKFISMSLSGTGYHPASQRPGHSNSSVSLTQLPQPV